MDWNDTLTILIAVDTLLNVKLLIGAWFAVRWWRNRHAQEGQSAVGSARQEDAQEDAAER